MSMKISDLTSKIKANDPSPYILLTKRWREIVLSKKKSAEIDEEDWKPLFYRKSPAAGIDWGEMLDVAKNNKGQTIVTNEKKSIKDNWDLILQPHIEDIINTSVESDQIRKIKDLRKIIDDLIKKGGGRERPTAINRMLTTFFPDLFVTIPQYNKLQEFINILRKSIEGGDSITPSDNWIDDSHRVRVFLNRELGDPDLSIAAWRYYDYLKENSEVVETAPPPKTNTKAYWLLGYSFGGNESQLNRFLDESIWEGVFTDQTANQFLKAKQIKDGDIIALKACFVKNSTTNPVVCIRLKAIGYVQGVRSAFKDENNWEHLIFNVKYIDSTPIDFDGNQFGKYRQTIHECDNEEIVKYINMVLGGMKTNNEYDKYATLLKANHNLILTGAPGTGKTYLAKQIAKAMGAEYKLVQFHPSYDYTDFVEGLRPVGENQAIGFERKDGVFKDFCKAALKRSAIEPAQALQEFKDDLEVAPISIPCFKNSKKYITIKLNEKGEMRVFPQRCKSPEGYRCSEKDVLDYIISGVYDKGHDTYQPSVGEYIKEKYLEKVDYQFIATILNNDTYKKNLFDEVYFEIAKDIIDGNIKLTTKDAKGGDGKYTYIVSDDGKIIVTNLDNSSRTGDKKGTPIDKIYYLVEYYLRNPSEWANESKDNFNKIIANSPLEGKAVDYYVWAIVREMIKRVCNRHPRPFVFIIDEINRGEISKIFGELFYSMDDGYRGEVGKVCTQYQNLVAKDDLFYDGFYIPNNVYIIGTMNDIDRSIESMDFAMRRRFAWKEITAKSRQGMLDEIDAWGNYGMPDSRTIAEIKARMDNLNDCIVDEYKAEILSHKEKIGLTKAYQIGASYFLKYAKYNDFNALWENHLEGLLYEYLRGSTNVEIKIERLKEAYNDTTIH